MGKLTVFAHEMPQDVVFHQDLHFTNYIVGYQRKQMSSNHPSQHIVIFRIEPWSSNWNGSMLYPGILC